MEQIQESSVFFEKIAKSLSKARLDSYKMQGGSEVDAFRKYVWNTLLCEALYPAFQILEVSFRNSLHCQIATTANDPFWLSNEISFLYPDEKEAIKKSKKSIIDRRGSVTEDYLVAEMSFGFWTSLLDTRYETMWPKIIKGVLPNMPKTIRTRGDASKLMNPVRKLRNAALHHHSIWHWGDLKDQHGKMITLIGYICDSSAFLVSKIDRFPIVYEVGYKNCGKFLDEIKITTTMG
jgi:hypothetical protein